MTAFAGFAFIAAVFALRTGEAFAAQPSGKPIDGILCQRTEGVLFHTHQHLALYDHGKRIEIPAGVGIVPGACLYWLHTHTPDGIVHIESPAYRDFTLGEFFDIWGKPLNVTNAVRVYVGGHLYEGNPRMILLSSHADIVIENGPTYFVPKPFIAWGGN